MADIQNCLKKFKMEGTFTFNFAVGGANAIFEGSTVRFQRLQLRKQIFEVICRPKYVEKIHFAKSIS